MWSPALGLNYEGIVNLRDMSYSNLLPLSLEVMMLNCPRCTSANKVKSGLKEGRQRYKCKQCRYLFTVAQKSDTATTDQRRLALTLYLEGLGFRSIGRVLGFSHVASISGSKRLARKSLRSSARRLRSLNSMNCIATWGIKKLLLGLDCC